MIGFFNPWALIGILLLAVPIAVHLFKPRKTRRTAFTNLRWLRESQHKLTRRVQWHQILLFLFRAALLSLLVLVLARPVLNLGGGSKTRERFIILDRSRTMNYADPAQKGAETPFTRGRKIAEELLASSGPGDRSTVILAARNSKALGPLSDDPQAYTVALRNAEVVPQEGDLGAALPVVRSMLGGRRDGAAVEIVFLTNSLQNNWSQSAISSFLSDKAADIKVRLIDVSPEKMQNAWLADAAAQEGPDGRVQSIRVEAGWSGDGVEEVVRSVHLTGVAGLPELSAAVVLKPGRLTSVEIPIPDNYDLRGKTARLEMRPEDYLPDDDSLLLTLNPRGMVNVLVVESEVTQVKALQPGLHLRSALQSLALVQKGRLEVNSVSPEKLSAEEIARASLFILVEPHTIPEASLAAIEARVRAGCGLAVFLGPSVNISSFNKQLHRANDPGGSLSPVALDQIVENRRGREEMGRLTAIQWSHPLLANLFDPSFNDFPQTRVSGYFSLAALPMETSARVVARIGNSVPAILESDFGAGKVVLFNTTANDTWSDLPRRPSFIPLLDRLVTHLSGGVGARRFMAGDAITFPLGSFEIAPEVEVTAPSGGKLRPTVRRMGRQFVLQLDSVEEAGVYAVKIEGGVGAQSFVVQTGRGDSNLARIKPDLLHEWWQPAEFESVSIKNTAQPAQNSENAGPIVDRRVPLWPWAAAVACVILLGEMALVHWLCPKLNPMLAESRLSHGLQKQGGTNEG